MYCGVVPRAPVHDYGACSPFVAAAASPSTPLITPPDYVPLPRWAGGHRMTVYAWARPRRFPRLPAPEARLFGVAPETQVLAHCHWQPERQSRSNAPA